jgi:hypothetical protein
MVVPVRVLVQDESGTQATLLAHTLDANPTGTRLGGFHGQVNIGQIVTVQYQHRRCGFRVIWMGKRGSAQGTQIGLQCLEPAKNIWNLDVPEEDSPSATSSQVASAMQVRWSLDDA